MISFDCLMCGVEPTDYEWARPEWKYWVTSRPYRGCLVGSYCPSCHKRILSMSNQAVRDFILSQRVARELVL
jgi:hypothetical protein